MANCVTRQTLEALEAQRLAMIQAGPSPDMDVHQHAYKLGTFLKEIDGRILALRRQLSEEEPFEICSRGR
jgi:hypothetical protein